MRRDTVRLVQFGDENAGWAVPAEDWRGLVREIITDYEGEWAGWNTKFDNHHLDNLVGCHPLHAHDGSIGAHLRDPLLSRAQKNVAAELVDPRAKQLDDRLERQMAEHRWTWGTVPIDFPTYWAYGALDPVLAARTTKVLRDRAFASGQGDLYYLEHDVSDIASRMEDRGLGVDVEYAQRMEQELEVRIDALRDWCRSEYGFAIGSTAAVRDRLEYDGVTFELKTGTGLPSLSKHSIGSSTHPLAVNYLLKKELEVRAHNFFRNIYRYAVDGVVHAEINTLQAKTGRMSIGRPSLQNQPRSKEVRDAFLAREGHLLVAADYAQIELRLFAHFARVAKMIEFFCAGRDMPQEVADELFGPGQAKPVRQHVKTSLYTLTYGGGPARIAAGWGWSFEQGQAFLDRLYGLYPEMPTFFNGLVDTAKGRGGRDGRPWVESPRWKRRYYVNYSSWAYKLVNYLIQGEAGIVLKQAIRNLDRAGLGQYMCIPVHDEVLSDVPVGDVEEVTRIYQEAMPNLTDYRVPLEVEVSGGIKRWGEKYAIFDEEPAPQEEEEEG